LCAAARGGGSTMMNPCGQRASIIIAIQEVGKLRLRETKSSTHSITLSCFCASIYKLCVLLLLPFIFVCIHFSTIISIFYIMLGLTLFSFFGLFLFISLLSLLSFWRQVIATLPRLVSNSCTQWSSHLSLLSSQDYSHVPPFPGALECLVHSSF
jgi:hypothetical protein